MPGETRAAERASDTERAVPTVMFARAGSTGSPREGAKHPIAGWRARSREHGRVG